MTKRVLLSFFVLFNLLVFADCDTCSAYKTQVSNDCDAINGELTAIINMEVNIKNYASGILSQPNINANVQYNAQRIQDECTSIYNRSISAQNYVDSIKNTAQSLVCATNSVGSCDCSSLLEDLIDDLSDLSSEVHNIYLSEINQEGLLYQTYYNLTLALTELRNIDTNTSSLSNLIDSANTTLSSIDTSNSSIDSKLSTIIQLITTADTILSQSYLKIDDIATKFATVFNVFNTNFWQFRDSHLSANSTMWSTSQFHFLSYNGQLGQAKSVMQNAIVADDFIRWIAQYFPLTVSSLNNYQYANYTNNAVVNRYLDHIVDYVSAPPPVLTNIVNNLRDFGTFFTNTTSLSNNDFPFSSADVAARILTTVGGDVNLDYVEIDTMQSGYYDTAFTPKVKNMSFKDMVVNFSKGHFRLLTSLNNYSYIILKSFDSVVDTVQSVSNAISSIERKFSLFTSSLYDSDTPLKYYDGNGSYHDYLTNYYIRLSEGQQSGTETFTNWFNRIEILLAALVFQDSSAGTNEFSDSAVSTSTIDQSKQQADNSINQVLQSSSSYTEIVNTSGQSIINMVSTWDSCLKNVSKPAPFAICEFGLHDSASEKEYFMFPMDNEIISSLVDIGHGISTICWITAFLFLGYAFSRWVISKLAMMISFAYDIYTAIFGGK